MKIKRGEMEDVEEDGEEQGMFQMATVGDGMEKKYRLESGSAGSDGIFTSCLSLQKDGC